MIRRKSPAVPRGTVLALIAVAGWCLVAIAWRYGPLLLDLTAQLAVAMPIWPHR